MTRVTRSAHSSPPLRRRELLLGVAAALIGGKQLVGCHGSTARLPVVGRALGNGGAHGPDGRPWDPTKPVELWSWFDLPKDDARSRELSGIAWDPDERVLWACQDESPTIVALIPDRDLRTWTFGRAIPIDVGAPIDLEALVVIPGNNGFIVTSEEGPHGPRIIEVDRDGRYRRDIALPPRFVEARNNQSLESLTASPSGRHLFTTTEVALSNDGAIATPQSGTRVRIVKMDRSSLREVSEHVYATDPMPYDHGDWGVSDLAAITDDSLLVLERGWSRGYGNVARIYQTMLEDPRSSCMDMDDLKETPVLQKTLRIDLSKLAAVGLPEPHQTQQNPLLDNYEGIALGPRLPDGRATILMVSDDNAHDTQFARVLVLAV